MNHNIIILTCLGPLDLCTDDELLLTEPDLSEQTETTEQTEQTEIGQLKDADIDNFIIFEKVVFDDRKLVQTCQSPVILPFHFIQSNKEHLTGFRVVYVIRTYKIRMIWILLPENRSQNNNFFWQ